ncbi:MAG: SDR family oxidoreductase [Spirochaetes bacterium]|jgi:NAD(P)-dependent dehydrogenase (short-subunit alcohol dehydrogenase family)|nr:SDR family oxidoreductase [Spirochaetota bacterium]
MAGGDFSEHVVVVTGSSRGIGRETARAFAAAGAHVVLNGRNRERLEEVRQELASAGYAVSAYACDVTVAEEARGLIEHAAGVRGRLDVLVNNAGISMRGPFADTAPEVVEEVTRVNILGAALPTRYAVPHLLDARGSVVFISSLAGVRGFPGVAMYSAAKMALTGLSQSLRAELEPQGVHVGSVWVSFTENDPDKQIYAADGTLMSIRRSWKTSQAEVAAAVLGVVARRRRELVMTLQGKLFVLLARLAPRLVDQIISRSRGAVHSYSR